MTVSASAEIQKSPTPAEQPNDKKTGDSGDQILIDLYQSHKILLKANYAKIRHVFAERFETAHRDAIRNAFGESASEFCEWLDKQPDVKEEFFLAIDPQHDDVPHALSLFRALYDRNPTKFAEYANLAIATAVVWDKEQGAIHGSPTDRAIIPEGQMGAPENYDFYIDMESAMQGRTRYLPWEFLVHVVNHRTTLPERKWAILYYLPKRAMIGKCRNDVPYDSGMLKGEPPKIAGKLFTLPNQRTYGGVCVSQSDYATRVAKSLGIPAFSAGAANKFGGGHAWMMWVELGSVTPTGFTFTLQSEGRFFGDKYYVGSVIDPHTGQLATDRQLELRLHTLGMDLIAKRQTDLVMRAYPMLCEKLHPELPEQLEFLGLVLKSCPGNEEAWKALARMSKEGQITKATSKPMLRALEVMFRTFDKFPDFTWVIFDDMTAFEDRVPQRANLYARLAGMYERAERIDLSCEARLRHADLLANNKQAPEAVVSLAAAVMLFPDEGRYVPKLLDRLDSLCKGDKKSEQQLARLYQQFLPKVPRMRGDEPSDFCLAMYKRGIDCFTSTGNGDLAKLFQIQLKLLEETKPEIKKEGRPIRDVIGKGTR
jgi:hypothetical protein